MNEIDGVNLIISLFLKNVLTLPSLQISFWFQIMHCCIPTPTIDNNSSTGMIRVTLNMGRTAVNHQGISHCLESGHPVHRFLLHNELHAVKVCASAIQSDCPSHTNCIKMADCS